MRELKVCYTYNRDNMGDAINPYIFNVLGVSCKYARASICEITGIGSGLRRFFLRPDSLSNIKEITLGWINPRPLILFSAGFLRTPTGQELCTRRNVQVTSVRGELSKKYCEQILGRSISCVTGDAGLLASECLQTDRQIPSCLPYTSKKKYSVGIIPHDKDTNDPLVERLHFSIKDSTIIKVYGDVISILERISECSTIISSSLHGLIFADSFHIPNIHIVISDRLSGDGFKFKDYYSSYGIDYEEPFVCNEESINLLTESYICSNYHLTAEMIESKKRDIKAAFYSCIEHF